MLRDPERRRQYDMFGPEAVRGAGAGAPAAAASPSPGSGRPVSATCSTPSSVGPVPSGGRAPERPAPRATTPRSVIDLEFTEAVFGVERELSVRLPVACATCGGYGRRVGTTPDELPTCGGSGEVRRVRQSILGQMVTASACPRCGGTGEEIATPCPDCRGEGRRIEEKSFLVEVPAGVDNGSTLRLPGRGTAGRRGGRTATSTSTCGSVPMLASPGTASTCTTSCTSP